MNDASRIHRFNQLCAIIGLAFLLLTQVGKWALYNHKGLSQAQDFTQYYMGGLMALHGNWDSIYPVPIPGALHNAGFEDSSTLPDKYRAAAATYGAEGSYRFMQPPPAALLFTPLAILPYKASHFVWIMILTFAAWGIGLQAGKTLALSMKRDTRWVGFVVLLVCCSLQAYRWVGVGNLSALMGWMTGVVVLQLVAGESVRGAAILTVGTALKYAQLILLPLHVAMRRWRTIGWTAALGAAMLILSLVIMGTQPYRTFANDIAPTLKRTSIPANQALYRFLLVSLGETREDAMPRGGEIAFRTIQFGLLAAMLFFIFKRPSSHWQEPRNVFAAALALTAWLIIFSPIFWEHYHAYLAPFWGWLIYQAMQSRLKMLVVVAAIALAYVPSALVLQKLHLPELPEPLFSHLLWSALLMYAMAMYELARRPKVAVINPPQTQTHHSP
jgi:hypothetical protein